MTRLEDHARKRLLERRERLVERQAAAALEVRSASARGGTAMGLAQAALVRTIAELANVDRALGQLTLGTFGVCGRCGRALGNQRLRADPEAQWCLECSDALEAERGTGVASDPSKGEVPMAAPSTSATTSRFHQQLERRFGDLVAEAKKDDRSTLRKMWAEFEFQVRAHIQGEEDELLRGYARAHPAEAAALRRDHAYFEDALTEFGVDLDLHLLREKAVEEFGERLRKHAEAEERGLYPWAEGERLVVPGAGGERKG